MHPQEFSSQITAADADGYAKKAEPDLKILTINNKPAGSLQAQEEEL